MAPTILLFWITLAFPHWTSALMEKRKVACTTRNTMIFSDTKFVYGRALAQVAGTAVMRMADAELLPYEFQDVSDTMHRYVNDLEKQAKQTRQKIEERRRERDDGV